MITMLTAEKRRLADRVHVGAIYTDGVEPYEIEAIGPTGCITMRDFHDQVRCLSLENFRAWCWLVRAELKGMT